MLLECKGVAVAQRLSPFSVSVAQGELIHLLGPNGAGKSTLLACLSGLTPTRGEVLFNDIPITRYSASRLARHCGWLVQQHMPPGNMPVWHYLNMHLVGDRPADEQTVMAVCDIFLMSDKLTRPLHQLSGGEWQRVRLAAVCIQTAQPEGQLLLLDEPLTGLDLARQSAFDRYLARRVADGLTVIMSSHDINHSLHYAHRVWLLGNGELRHQGAAAEVLQAENVSEIYGIPFRRLNTAGQPFLTTLPEDSANLACQTHL
ncbi:vitamin B12 ABC transporter ATP-binding protein BtuD [Erwinia mallotivora]|uniref:vitamin B12 ABC transporter ATP-binding protein BtuD n=1 Tax=Erwinia mallotivora TaxID=69222 RepID=UPI0021BF0651|nr:vitamin B12 ABC transporter ATP-binding protein BtuD [Erwinia mallotivora]